MIKIINKLGIEGNYLNIIKTMYEKPTVKLHSVMKVLPLR